MWLYSTHWYGSWFNKPNVVCGWWEAYGCLIYTNLEKNQSSCVQGWGTFIRKILDEVARGNKSAMAWLWMTFPSVNKLGPCPTFDVPCFLKRKYGRRIHPMPAWLLPLTYSPIGAPISNTRHASLFEGQPTYFRILQSWIPTWSATYFCIKFTPCHN
jgi:hypothetical protein